METIDLLDNIPKYSNIVISKAVYLPSCLCVLQNEYLSIVKSFKYDY